MNDATYDLDRFVQAQEGVYDAALAELRQGRKESHWMWFVFPQFAGLGHSAMAQRYAIGSMDEARAYLRHPVLGPRLKACTAAVNRLSGRSARDIFGTPDNLKFRSSMTLFAAADPGEPLFRTALEIYFGGVPDSATEAKVAA
ncbi:Uncharacterized protein, DUF1810 family [Pseudoxanthobacter soli DSM 19599]|uniref:Uncharacterized protein, DUF1810 family n=1 Tax=Pseudoxanthobacter soli DSM 19599 TaxID=1123029 RepID=A0A1M7ZDE1_9HYPH|nr:DUF1810 domain-containing protein [Pseudoxanthobacter soli]SHO62819.1 Uncharacterized protein, DUF1810 family [Pseudoxanthobacter soli DSM 19599]